VLGTDTVGFDGPFAGGQVFTQPGPPTALAAGLYLSEATVKSHIVRILAKLGLRDRVQVAVYAYEHGIVIPGRSALP
jgi:hypothetical protein